MKTHRIVVVGAGVAGARAAEAIAARSPAQVVVIGAEAEWPYHRPIVSKELLTGAPVDDEQQWIATPAQWQARGLELRAGVAAVALRPDDQALWLANGDVVHFDRVVLATGSTPRRLAVPGATLPGVLTLRSMHDARALAPRLTPGQRVVVLGGGPLGLEVAEAAHQRGASVTLVERAPFVLGRVVGPLLAPRLSEWLGDAPFAVRTSALVRRVVGSHAVEGVELLGGEVLPAETVVMAVGAEPATAWLEGSGLVLENGAVAVDALGQSSHPRVFAAGEVAAAHVPRLGRRVRVEHVGWAWQHGEAVGRAVAGEGAPFDVVPSASVGFLGHRVQLAGDVSGPDACAIGPVGARGHVAALQHDDRLQGVVAFDAPAAFLALRRELGQPMRSLADWLSAP